MTRSDRPRDEHCGDYEYITELHGIWFIVSIRGEYRIHPEEIPEQLRDKPVPPSRFWGWKKTGLAWLAGAVTTLLISLAMHQRDQHLFAIYLYASILLPVFVLPALLLIVPLTSNTRAERERAALRDQRAAWIQATYRDCGIQQPTIWLNTTSHYIESPSATRGI